MVVPTRELCTQVTNDLLTAGKVRNVRVLAIYGGRAYEPQVEALKKGVDVIVGTPGRLLDLAGQKKLDLSKVKALVLDEADEMLDLGFLPDVERIMSYLPAKRQTMLFSATMPGAVIGLARRYMTQPTHIRAVSEDGEGATVANTTQHVFRAHNMDKPELVSRILQAEGRGLAMIFCRTKRTAADIAEQLEKRGFASGAVHGDLGQGAREQALRAFRNGKVDVLVCTDVAARGIDVEGVTHVINYQTPEDEKTFLHRVGRTGRAGKKGIAVTLVDWDDIPRWQLINKALELDFHDPVETYSTSPHLYEQMNIPAGTKGVLPRAERTRAGLKAENLEDLGETGGRGARGGRDGGRDSGRDGGRDRGRDAGRDGGRGVAAPVAEERAPRTPRQRRRTRGGSDQGAELLTPVTTEAAPVSPVAPAVQAQAVQAQAVQAPEAPAADEARKPRRRRTRSAAPAATFVAPATALEPLAPFVVEPEVDFQMAPLVEPVRERRTSAPGAAPRVPALPARPPPLRPPPRWPRSSPRPPWSRLRPLRSSPLPPSPRRPRSSRSARGPARSPLPPRSPRSSPRPPLRWRRRLRSSRSAPAPARSPLPPRRLRPPRQPLRPRRLRPSRSARGPARPSPRWRPRRRNALPMAPVPFRGGRGHRRTRARAELPYGRTGR